MFDFGSIIELLQSFLGGLFTALQEILTGLFGGTP